MAGLGAGALRRRHAPARVATCMLQASRQLSTACWPAQLASVPFPAHSLVPHCTQTLGAPAGAAAAAARKGGGGSTGASNAAAS